MGETAPSQLFFFLSICLLDKDLMDYVDNEKNVKYYGVVPHCPRMSIWDLITSLLLFFGFDVLSLHSVCHGQ